jgi:cytochrome c-type biogenesis protein CcmE
MTRKQKRLAVIGGAMAFLAVAAALTFAALGQKTSYFYSGLLPDLFREGQGVVTEGVMGADGVFVADSVLAKHDETYMPREVAESLKEKGVWQHAE